jgi:hypothetical protein
MLEELSQFLKLAVQSEEVNNSNIVPDNISTDSVLHPIELIHTLRLEILPLLQSLHNAFVINDFKLLGEKLERIAQENRVQYFSIYAANIQELVDSFDIRGITHCVNTISAAIDAFIIKLEIHNGR